MTEQTRYEIVVQRNGDFIDTFTGIRQERTLAHLSKFCMEKRCTFDKDSDRWTNFNEGKRAVILEIRHWLDMDISKLEED